jgi:hypothetical protein
MKKIIGGLLLLSLLSRPSILRIDFIAYEFYRSNQVLIESIKRNESLLNTDKEEEVDRLMEDIDTNKRYIERLNYEKNAIIQDMENLMYVKSKSKEAMSGAFILQFREFNELYTLERGDALEHIESIKKLDLTDIQQEILHNDMNIDYILAAFKACVDSQKKIIGFLERVIHAGKRTLALG